jgi:hypothetical protein
MRMRIQDWGMLLLIYITVVIIALAVIYGITTVVQQVTDVMVEVIAAAATIIGAIVTHALTAIREQNLQQQRYAAQQKLEEERYKKQQKLEQQRQKQSNYAQLIRLIGPYVRYPERIRDELDTAHLLSWVYGSPDVVMKTVAFKRDITDRKVLELLRAIRDDVGVQKLDIEGTEFLGVFGPKETETPGHVRKESGEGPSP